MHRLAQARSEVEIMQPVPAEEKEDSTRKAEQMLHHDDRAKIRKPAQQKEEETRIDEIQTGVVDELFAIQLQQSRPKVIGGIRIQDRNKRQREPPRQGAAEQRCGHCDVDHVPQKVALTSHMLRRDAIWRFARETSQRNHGARNWARIVKNIWLL